ncbi:virginiamycin B lyase [Actinorhabdospora filicis]|uniref:Virginiamycin B lyase n=1 Tax=Actinorhabdospora filicis TaxID=1785913 RepID=A0A9W6SJF2_9ACTN|nr:virginiamycin B lyase [Actinorhabdospora filicis]GLZ76689.1 virginiamycin B lyase [Actinorhabdospora filicis]
MPLREHLVSGPEAGPYALTAAADGTIWFTLVHQGAIGHFDPATGRTRTYSTGDESMPGIIVTGADGGVWASLSRKAKLARLDPSTGEVTAFDAPAGVFGLAAAPDGKLWVTGMAANTVASLDPATGVLDVVELPVEGAMPSMIAVAADGTPWFTANQANAVGRVRDGKAELFELPTASAGPVGVTIGPDGAAWFVALLAGIAGRVDADGTVTEIPLPDRGSKPHAIVSDGTCLWISLWGADALAHLTVDGEVTTHPLTAGSEPHGLAVAPDGAIWTALENGHLARLTP